jgi:hypothetical protein
VAGVLTRLFLCQRLHARSCIGCPASVPYTQLPTPTHSPPTPAHALAGVLFLPWTYDLSQLLVAGVFLATGLYGPQIWSAPFVLFGFELTAALVVYIASVGSAFFSILLT